MKHLILLCLCHISFASSAIDINMLVGFLDSIIKTNHKELIDANQLMSNPGKPHYYRINSDTLNNPDLLGVICLFNDGAFGEVYKKNLNETSEEEIILVFSINPLIESKFEFFVFDSDRNSNKLLGNEDIIAKNSNAEIFFINITSNDYFDIEIVYDELSTYISHRVSIFKLVKLGLKCIYSGTALFYDWKHYGKLELMEINNYLDTLSESQSRRITTEICFILNEKNNEIGIVEIIVDAIVTEPNEPNNIEIEDYEIVKIIKKEENNLTWDSKNEVYIKNAP